MTTPDASHHATIRAALLPCPFCGAKAELFRDEEMSHNQDFWAVECLNSDCDGFRGYYPNEKTAFDQWNRRAPLDTLAAGQWTPTSMELYEYPDGKKALAYTGSDGYGRAQLRYLQDTDTDTPRETIIVLPEHLRLWKLATRETTDVE